MSRNLPVGISRACTVAVSLVLSLSLFAERTTKEELEQSGPLVDLTVPEGTTAGSACASGYPVKNLFDNAVESNVARWLGSYAANNMWAVYTFDTAKCVNAFMLKNAGYGGYNQTGRAPKTFRLRGSNDFDGSNYATATWVDLDSEASETGWTSGEKRYYSFKNATAYASYALHVNALNGGTDYVQLDEMEMYCISTDYVTVAGDPAAFGSPDPAYGDCFEVETGVAKTFRAPTAYTNAADTLRAACAGWIHKSSDGATLDSGDGNETSITYGADAVGSVLTWRWNAQCLLSFSASAGGTVTGTPGWKTYGVSVTLTPVPSQGYTFLGWEGDVDAEDAQTAPLELTMDRPRAVSAIFAPPAIQGAVLVSPAGDDATGDGSAWNKSYRTVGAALAAVEPGATIQLAPGRYELTSELALDKAVTIVGAGKGETVLTRAASVDNMRILNMTAAATVRDLTITGGYLTKAPTKTDAGAGAGVQMTDGTLDNCEICGCTNGIVSGTLYGGAIAASGTACLTGCVIRANYAVDLHGGALSLAGSARATHCLIADNVTHKVRVFSTGSGASVRVSSSTAELVNCTVTRNFSARSAAANVSAGVARNCLIWGNDGLETNDKGFDAGKYDSKRFPGCYIGGANPDFVDALRDDFRLMADSPVADGVGAFAKLSYGEEAACELRADSPIVLAEADVTFAATAFNCTPTTYVWNFGDGTPSETTTEPTVVHAYAAHGVYTVKLTVDGETSCVRTNYLTVRPKKMYVNAASTNPAYPYATAATAARDVDTVGWLLLKGMALEIAVGDYRMESTLRIPENMTVVGSGWTNCVLRQNGTSRAITLYGGARLENVMVTGGVTPNWNGAGGIKTFDSNWTIAGCCITNNASTGNNDNGGGLSVGTGTITHCIVCNNRASGSGPGTSGTGGGLYVSGTLKMDNCLIYGNSATDNGGGIYLASTSYLTNCTVVGNTIYNKTGGGIYLESGAMSSRLVNCIFSDNVADKDADGGKPNWGIASDSQANREKTYGKVKNCLFNNELVLGQPVVDGSVSGVPQFQSVAENDYHLKANSPARDAGLPLEEGSVDLDGNVRDAKPDMGCFEFTAGSVFSCTATVNPMAAFVDEDVELTASATNQPSGSTVTFTWTLTDTENRVYEIEGAHVKAPFPHPGKFTVRLDAAAGGQAAMDALENRLQIAVRTNYVASAQTDAARFPYDTPGTAATNVLEILPWTIDGSTIVADAGDHLLKDVVTLDKAVSVVGAGMNATTFRRAETKTGRCFVLNHSAALVSDITIADGYCGEQFSGGGNVYIDSVGGAVRRCRLTRGIVRGSNNGCGGAAVYMGSASALVENCEIVANTNEHSNADSYTQGAIVKASYGTLRNCLIANNRCSVMEPVAVGASATLDNCTVVDNETLGSQKSAVALSSGGGNVRNCIFSGNRSPNNANEDSAALGKPNWFVSAENVPSALQKIKNCCWDGSTPAGTDALAGSLLAFRDAANGNWRLAAACGLYGKGLNDETWMRTATDLDGKPRILGRKVDPGCYEMDAHGLMMIVR